MLRKIRRTIACVATVTACLGLAYPTCLLAQDNTSPYALGDWGGARTRLAEQGLTFSIGYGSELAHNTQGGAQDTTRHSGQFALTASADLQRLWDWQGAHFQISVSERDGRSLGAKAGIDPLMPIQENYGRGQATRLSELWLSQTFLDDRVLVKLGRMGVGADFSLFACDFMNITFCGGQPANTVYDYWQSWPISQWGALTRIKASDDWTVGFGVYQINPYYAAHPAHGFALFPSGTTGALLPAELQWTPTVHGLPGNYKLGGWYSTADRDDVYTDVEGGSAGLSGLDFERHPGSYGGYLMLQQKLTGDAAIDGPGISVDFNLLQSDRSTNAIYRAIAGELTWRGIWAPRPRDMLGVGYGTTQVNPRTVNYQRDLETRTGQGVAVQSKTEQTAEVFYAIQVMPWLVIRPDLQWIHNPGGRSGEQDVHVLGLKSSIAF